MAKQNKSAAEVVREAVSQSRAYLLEEINKQTEKFAEEHGMNPKELTEQAAADIRIMERIRAMSREINEERLTALVEAIIGRKLPRPAVVSHVPLVAVAQNELVTVVYKANEGTTAQGTKHGVSTTKTNFRLATPEEIAKFCEQATEPVVLQLLTLTDLSK